MSGKPPAGKLWESGPRGTTNHLFLVVPTGSTAGHAALRDVVGRAYRPLQNVKWYLKQALNRVNSQTGATPHWAGQRMRSRQSRIQPVPATASSEQQDDKLPVFQYAKGKGKGKERQASPHRELLGQRWGDQRPVLHRELPGCRWHGQRGQPRGRRRAYAQTALPTYP